MKRRSLFIYIIFFLKTYPFMLSAASNNYVTRFYDPNVSVKWKTYWASKDPSQYVLNEKKIPYKKCFKKASIKYKLPLSLLVAVAKGESNFNPSARSISNAYGVMQIIWPETAHWLGIKSLKELKKPCINIMAGSRYLKYLINNIFKGNLHWAIASYNYGQGNVLNQIKFLKKLSPGANSYSSYIYRQLIKILADGALEASRARMYFDPPLSPPSYFQSQIKSKAFKKNKIPQINKFKFVLPLLFDVTKNNLPLFPEKNIIRSVDIGGYEFQLKWVPHSEDQMSI